MSPRPSPSLALRYNCAMKAGHLEFDPETLRHFCEKWGVAELAVFGSVLRDDFRPDSDIDCKSSMTPAIIASLQSEWRASRM